LAVVSSVWVAVEYWPKSRDAQWQAVEAVATVVTAVVAVVGLIGLVFFYKQNRDSMRRFRVELGPYLRVDLAPDVSGGTWAPPARESLSNALTASDIGEESSDLGGLRDWPGKAEICIWLWNTQPHTAGIAHRIWVDVEFVFPDATEASVERVLKFELHIAYLAPGQRIRYLVASISDQIPWITGRVTGVRYLDLYERELRFAQGSAEFRLEGSKLLNERHVFREEAE
jgi:hypothetical protein